MHHASLVEGLQVIRKQAIARYLCKSLKRVAHTIMSSDVPDCLASVQLDDAELLVQGAAIQMLIGLVQSPVGVAGMQSWVTDMTWIHHGVFKRDQGEEWFICSLMVEVKVRSQVQSDQRRQPSARIYPLSVRHSSFLFTLGRIRYTFVVHGDLGRFHERTLPRTCRIESQCTTLQRRTHGTDSGLMAMA
jgi:hypothetical protein